MTARVDRLMADYAEGPGASVLVVRDGVIALARSYGYAELETRRLATPRTAYRLASLTKAFTAAAVLLLAEDRALELDDPVRRWLPELPSEAAEGVTLRHLLTHTSGLHDYEDLVPDDATAALRDADVLRLLAGESRVHFAPGAGYRYSNSGYALLALVVERASARPFESFLAQRIFAPLGMDGAVAHVEGESVVAERAYGYTHADGRWARTDQSLTSAVLGDGGIYASITDLAKWDAAWNDARLLAPASRAAALAPATPTDEPGVAYGYGWRRTGDTVWHSGETIGFRNVIVRWPERRTTVVVLSNRNDPEPYRTALEIGALYGARDD